MTDSTTLFNRASVIAAASQLSAEVAGLSPSLDRSQAAPDFMLEVLSYYGGFYRINSDGAIEMGLARKVGCNDESIPTIDETCLLDLPVITVEGMEKAVNQVAIKFTDDQNEYQANAVTAYAPGNIIFGAPANMTILERPWITQAATAERLARATAHSLSLPAITGTLKVRKSKLQGLRAGDSFYLNYATYGLRWLHCRILELGVPDPYKPEVEIAWEWDRSQAQAEVYNASVPAVAARIDPKPVAIPNLRVIELPYYRPGFIPNLQAGDAVVTLIAERPTAAAAYCKVHEDMTLANDASSFVEVGTVGKWAVRGETLTTSGPTTPDIAQADQLAYGNTFSIVCNFTSDFTLPPGIINDPGRNKFDWLLLIQNEFFKVLSISAGTPSDPTNFKTIPWTLTVKREGLDTCRNGQLVDGPASSDTLTYGLASEVWLMQWSDLEGNAQIMRSVYRQMNTVALPDAAMGLINLKFQPLVGSAVVPLDSLPVVVHHYRDRSRRPWAPKFIQVNGASVFEYYPANPNFTLSWDAVNRDGGLAGFPAGLTGIQWIVDIRRAGAAWDYANYTAGTHYSKAVDGNSSSITITTAALTAALGTLNVNLEARLFSLQSGIKSLYYQMVTLTKKP